MSDDAQIYQVVPLQKEKWKGYPLPINFETVEYYDVSIEEAIEGFEVTMIKRYSDEPIVTRAEDYDFPDSLYQPHWEKAEAFGVMEGEELIAAIEVCPEEWSNRLAVTELLVKEDHRRQGIGHALMSFVKEKAVADGRRAIILETQSRNVTAIAFYRHEGFELIGFDSCCYTNADIKRKEVRLDMGWFPEKWKDIPKRR